MHVVSGAESMSNQWKAANWIDWRCRELVNWEVLRGESENSCDIASALKGLTIRMAIMLKNRPDHAELTQRNTLSGRMYRSLYTDDKYNERQVERIQRMELNYSFQEVNPLRKG